MPRWHGQRGVRRGARLPPARRAERQELHAGARDPDGCCRRACRSGSPRDRRSTSGWWQMLRCPALDCDRRRGARGQPGPRSGASDACVRVRTACARAMESSSRRSTRTPASADSSTTQRPGTLPSSTFNLFSLSGTVSYSLDIWGGQRRQVEVLGAAVDAQRYSLAGAHVMLASNVVDAVIAQAAYRDEIDVTQATLGPHRRAGAHRERAGDRRDDPVLDRAHLAEPAGQHQGDAPAARGEDRPGDRSSRGARWPNAGELEGGDRGALRSSSFPRISR